MAPVFRSGKNAKLTLVVGTTVTGGTSYDLSSGLTDASMTRGIDSQETTTFGDTDKSFVAGMRSGSYTCSGFYASTYEDILSPLVGQSTNIWLVYRPVGVGAAYPRMQSRVIITQFDVPAAANDVVKMNVTFQRTGALKSTKGP